MKEEYYKRYLTILVIIYILVIAAYIFLIITLIKKDIYNPSSSKKLAGGWCITSFLSVSYTHLDVYKRQGQDDLIAQFCKKCKPERIVFVHI